jgi:signal peptidase I
VSEAEGTREGPVVDQPTKPKERRALLRGVAADWLKSLLVALAIFLVVRTFVVEAFKIPTSSMENTLLVGDFLLVNKAVYRGRVPGTDLVFGALSRPERGDVVVFHPPHEPHRNYVKRLVGLPSDTLEMRDKGLYVNGRLMPEPYVQHVDGRGDTVHPDMEWQSNHLIAAPPREYHPTRDNWGPLVVPDGHYFMLGDNRDNSEDSRYWGFVSRDHIQGRPWLVYYSQAPHGASGEPWYKRVRWGRLGTVIR